MTPLNAPRGPIRYPRAEIPEWLDSDPFGRNRQPPTRTAEQITAAGGICAPVGNSLFDLFRPPSGLELLQAQQRRLNESTRWRNKARRWWRAHWWPAVIADLREKLGDS